jgi:subtilisin family serine protease
VIVRNSLGLSGINFDCFLIGCNVVGALDGSIGHLFLVSSNTLDVQTLISDLLGLLGVVDAEPQQILQLSQSNYSSGPPPWLTDTTPTTYYGATVWHGYITQPAVGIIGSATAQSQFNVSGSGVVAIIDTGIDPTHPALSGVVVAGYDFTRNSSGGSEMPDAGGWTPNGQQQPGSVNQSTVAMLDQSTVAMLDQNNEGAFGHGTMTAGIVHLVAPTASLMPLKAFQADGTGNLSDVLRALYYATQNHANVVNMSFSFPTYSPELAHAANYATNAGLVLVASAGNNGEPIQVYPSALSNVIGVGSTDNYNNRSTFSNYGSPDLELAAPGEGIMAPYPWGTYAAGWGTSFSAPLVTGTAALLLQANGGWCNQQCASGTVDHTAMTLTPDLNYGLLQVVPAVQARVQNQNQNQQ